MYSVEKIGKVITNEGAKCLTISSVKDLIAAIANIDEKLAIDGLNLPTGNTTMTSEYNPVEVVSAELNSNEL